MATIYGSYGSDVLRGSSTADAIYGLWGDDSISGVEGRDFLYGGSGDDTLDGGAGVNFLDGGAGFDLALYSSFGTPIQVDIRTGSVTVAGRPGDTLANVEAVAGGGGSDLLIGDGAGNSLQGNSGHDTLIGNYGSDSLTGLSGNDSIEGGNGPDFINGGPGRDTLVGGLHDDTFSFYIDSGRDVVDGGPGTDTIFLNPDLYRDVQINLGAGTMSVDDYASQITSIENVWVIAGDATVIGSSVANLITVGEGDNVVYAGGGNDTIFGGEIYAGRDPGATELLSGGAGDDLIYGGGEGYPGYSFGNETLVGGGGNDTLQGGGANDTMSGGAGNDLFIVNNDLAMERWGDGFTFPSTTVTDFQHGQDRIGFGRGMTFAGSSAAADLAVGEVGYHLEGGDTVVEARLGDTGSDASDILAITLTGYSGPLAVSDFDL